MTPQEKINRLTRGNHAAPSPLAPAMLPVSVAPPPSDFRTAARETGPLSTASQAAWPETVAVVPDPGHQVERGSIAWRLAVAAFTLLTLGTAGYVWFAASH